MQALENWWGGAGWVRDSGPVEPPPQGLLDTRELRRDIQMLHPTLGRRVFPAGSDFENAVDKGWYPDMHDRTNFLKGVHIQAYYFQARFFQGSNGLRCTPHRGSSS